MRVIKSFLIGLLLLSFYTNASWKKISAGKIYEVENAWFGEGLAFKHTTAVEGCAASDNEYAVIKEHTGYDSVHAIILTAIATQADTELIIEKRGTCVFGERTKVIAIKMLDGNVNNNQAQE